MKYAATLLLSLLTCSATIIPDDRRTEWTPGVTVGVQGGIIIRPVWTNATASPYNADPTGATSSTAAIQNAVNDCPTNMAVYLPAGVYDVTSGFLLGKSYVTLRGAGLTNTILVGHGRIGQYDATPTAEKLVVTNGANKGSSQLQLASLSTAFGNIVAGAAFTIGCEISQTNPAMPYISVLSVGDRLLRQEFIVKGVTGTTLTIYPPLGYDFTNQPTITPLNGNLSIQQMTKLVGLEDLTLSATNNGLSDLSTPHLMLQFLDECWLSNAGVLHSHVIGIESIFTCGMEINHCQVGQLTSAGTSHGGILETYVSGELIQDCIFQDAAPGLEVNGGVGNAYFGNYFTNSWAQTHGTHPAMYLFEANVFESGFIELDGYFGSASDFTILRNSHPTTLSIKRWNSRINVIGNVLANTNYPYVYTVTNADYSTPYPIFQVGYPNIGDVHFSYAYPDADWRWPGYFSDYNTNHNISFVITNDQVNVTNLIGDFSGVPDPNAYNFNIRFQDNLDTNSYWPKDGQPVLPVAAGTSSNLFLNRAVTVSNHWTALISSAIFYQTMQFSNLWPTMLLHGNLLATNTPGTVVWDATISDHVIPTSFLYTNGPPAWWGTNHWPAIGPETMPPVGNIPAWERAYGYPTGGSNAPIISIDVANQTNYVGSNVLYSISVAGTTPFHYQWFDSGGAISGATNATYALTGLQFTDTNRSPFHCVITNILGTNTSQSGTLTVLPIPGLTLACISPNVAIQGDAFAGTAVATWGTPPYYWTIVSGQLPTGLTLDGATGIITGTPTGVATNVFTIQVGDGPDGAPPPPPAASQGTSFSGNGSIGGNVNLR